MSDVANTLGLGLLRQPRTVLFGPGQRRHVARLAAELGDRVLVCTDARGATTAEFREIADALAAEVAEVLVFDRVEPDLPRSDIQALLAEFGERGVDVVVGLGGGSCLDMAKVASVMLAHGGDVRDYYGENVVPGPGLPVITVPTTGGTGAEVTCIAVVYDEERAVKVGVASEHLEPVAAVIDPELTLTCPPGLTAATGADALSHLVESFTDRAKNPDSAQLAAHLYVGKNRLTDVYCRTGLALLATSLERVVADPSDLEARSDTMFAAYCAGMAINTAGTALAHALQSPIGGLTHTPHGIGVGVLLPYVMRFNRSAHPEAFTELAEVLGVRPAGSDDEAAARAAIERVEEILARLGVPVDLAALGLDAADIPTVAEQAMLSTRLLANNARPVTVDDARDLLERAHRGDRSWWT